MISYFKNLKLNKLKAKSYKLNKGMTYIELIVVLGIFSTMTSIVLFNYNAFQEKVDIKVLANNIALKIVEAQKSSISGKWNSGALSGWKPSYGTYFDLSDNKNFIFFVDLNNNNFFDSPVCNEECLDSINITKNNHISQIDSYLNSTATSITSPLSITFKRSDSGAVFKSNDSILTGFDYLQITVTSPSSIIGRIKVYPSGRIQID
jgi:type II secretory pathway pseudopilin PulG